MQEHEIRQIIKSEIEGSSIRKVVEEVNKPKVNWRDVLRHPLFLTLAAFTLTTFVGGALERKFSNRAEILADERKAIAALNDFVGLAMMRSVETDLLRSALKRGVFDEAAVRKKDYDLAYKAWNVDMPKNLLSLRAAISHHPSNSMNEVGIYERVVTQSLASLFRYSDRCLTRAYDYARGNGFYDITDFQDLACGNKTGKALWFTTLEDKSRDIKACVASMQEIMGHEIRAITEDRLTGKYGNEDELLASQAGFFNFRQKSQNRYKQEHIEWREKVHEELSVACPGI